MTAQEIYRDSVESEGLEKWDRLWDWIVDHYNSGDRDQIVELMTLVDQSGQNRGVLRTVLCAVKPVREWIPGCQPVFDRLRDQLISGREAANQPKPGAGPR
jgi:hypothetical protein